MMQFEYFVVEPESVSEKFVELGIHIDDDKF